MAKGNSGGRRGGGASGGGTTISNVPTNPVNLTDKQANDLRDQQDSMYDANTTAAVKQYISRTDFDGQNHSMSQTMNYLLDNGVDLQNTTVDQINKQYGLRLSQGDLASMQYSDAYMKVAMHNLGMDANLQRGSHDDLLKQQFGISDYTKLSDSQLKSKLVGQEFANTSYMSTSYDITKNPFLSASSGSGVSGGREVVWDIKAGSGTKCLFGAKSQSEIIIDKGTNFRITDVGYTGGTATPAGKGFKPVIKITVETF